MVLLKRAPLHYPDISLLELLKRNSEGLQRKYAIVYPAKLTYVDFWACVDKLAKALINIGVRKTERVCLFEGTTPEFEIAFNAVVGIGAVVVPLNPMSKENEIEYIINDSSAETIIVRDELPIGLSYIVGSTNIVGITISDKEPALSGNDLIWNFADVPQVTSIIIEFGASAISDGQQINVVNIEGNDGMGGIYLDSDTAIVIVNDAPNPFVLLYPAIQ